jgi:hypothetical protein
MLATWSQFDAQPGFWIKPSSHTKQRREHRLPLSAPALPYAKFGRTIMYDEDSLAEHFKQGEITPVRAR